MSLLPPSHSPPVFLPEELIAEVLSWITVMSLMRLKCVSKSWNSLISDPTFVKLHLNRSSQNSDFTFAYSDDDAYNSGCKAVSFTLIRSFENTPIIINFSKDPYHQLNDKDIRYVVNGSCNGLLCLLGSSSINGNIEKWFRFWNPATRSMSPRLGSFCDDDNITFNFTFGCDKSNNAYKVVALTRTKIRVFSLQDNAWRNIQHPPEARYCTKKAVHLRGSVNWLIVRNHYGPKGTISNKLFGITSLDLDTETHTNLSPPHGFHEITFVIPNLSVLKDCLCFSYDFEETHLIIWQMKEFGMKDSWTQILKISYRNLQLEYQCPNLLPLYLWEKNDALLLTKKLVRGSIIYNWRDDRQEKIFIPWWCSCFNYVESLVSYC